jgi:Spy/CpxP family protein refolding chaperone
LPYSQPRDAGSTIPAGEFIERTKEIVMKKRNVIIGSVVGLVALAAIGVAGARPGGFCGAGLGADHSPFAGPMMHGHGHGHLRHLMRQLDLTEEQRDKVFDILYAQVPAAREKTRELREGREALVSAAMSGNYDPQQVRTLADAQAKPISDLIVMRTETLNKIYAVLTPEQQASRRG